MFDHLCHIINALFSSCSFKKMCDMLKKKYFKISVSVHSFLQYPHKA